MENLLLHNHKNPLQIRGLALLNPYLQNLTYVYIFIDIEDAATEYLSNETELITQLVFLFPDPSCSLFQPMNLILSDYLSALINFLKGEFA